MLILATCQANHLPKFVELINELKAKADIVAVVAANDPFVMSAWYGVEGYMLTAGANQMESRTRS